MLHSRQIEMSCIYPGEPKSNVSFNQDLYLGYNIMVFFYWQNFKIQRRKSKKAKITRFHIFSFHHVAKNIEG
jgi:hypothetical protein